MIYLIAVLMLFVLFVMSHALVFRLQQRKLNVFSILMLLGFWGTVFLAGTGIVSGFDWGQLLAARRWLDLPLLGTSMMIYMLLGLWYFGVCIGVLYKSPSMEIINALDEKPGKKISRSELKELFSNDRLIRFRIEDLVAHSNVKRDHDRYTLLPKGAVALRVIQVYRQLLGREMGG